MADRDGQHFSLRTGVGERSGGVLYAHLHRLADVFQSRIAHESAWQKPRFAQDLKTITDSEHQTSAIGKPADRLHYWREFRNRAGAQVVAKSKPSGDDDGVAVLEVMRFVPEEGYRLLGNLLNRPVGIVVAVRTGKDDDSEFHRRLSLGDLSSV